MTSIRYQLPASYALIALLATLTLGGALVAILEGHYRRQERDYLYQNAETVQHMLQTLRLERGSVEVLSQQLAQLAFIPQTQIRVYDLDGALIGDSGTPDQPVAVFEYEPVMILESGEPIRQVDVGAWQERPEARNFTAWLMEALNNDPQLMTSLLRFVPELRQWISHNEQNQLVIAAPPALTQPRSPDDPPPPRRLDQLRIARQGQVDLDVDIEQTYVLPLTYTVQGFEIGLVDRPPALERSAQAVSVPLYDSDGRTVGQISVTGGPAVGQEIMDEVIAGWLIASVGAVIVAASVGWLMSLRLTRPLVLLTQATTAMSQGDLTARAHLKRRDEIGILAETFNEMAARVGETIKTLQRFVADAAHEIHTPLTALRTRLELRYELDPDPHLAAAIQQVERLQHLADDLLDLSRIEAGSLEQTAAPVDLRALIDETAAIYASRAEQVDLDLALEVDLPGGAQVIGRRGQLQQALCNLLDNAIKFTPSGGQIALRMTGDGHAARIEVSDTGIGIPEEDLPTLFSRFRRGSNAANYKGSGLGLAIVRAIVEGHGGQIDVERLNPGTRFVLALPVMKRS